MLTNHYLKLSSRKIDPLIKNYIIKSIKNFTDSIYQKRAINSMNNYKNVYLENRSESMPPKIPPNIIFLILGFFTLCCFYKNANMFSYSKYINESQ